jgi:hypothetical protein
MVDVAWYGRIRSCDSGEANAPLTAQDTSHVALCCVEPVNIHYPLSRKRVFVVHNSCQTSLTQRAWIAAQHFGASAT